MPVDAPQTDPDGPAPLVLEVVSGPPLAAEAAELRFAPGSAHALGRSPDAAVPLPDGAVSRRHAELVFLGSAWAVRDLGSRAGTLLNGQRVESGSTATLADKDQLRIGPWVFRVTSGALPPRLSAIRKLSTADGGARESRVQRVPQDELRSIAQQRMDLVIDCAGRIHAATDLDALAAVVLESLLAGAGFARAAMVRPPTADGAVEVLGYRSRVGESADELELSRSLLLAAHAGETVRLTLEDAPAAAKWGQSIAELRIHSALCAPVLVGSETAALIYLDARGAERAVEPDAAAFCQAVARIAGLAIANIRRQELERERRRAHHDLELAREAQRLIMPPAHGQRGWHAYALEARPGRSVAGDLFDVVALSDATDGPVACFLGDVSGKGIGAAITMASVQTHLRVELRYDQDPARVVSHVNRALADRLTGGRFISLWIGVLDPTAGQIRYVDAGHGYWLYRASAREDAQVVRCEGGLPLGLDPQARYVTETLPMGPGARVALFSDGLTDQRAPDGEPFGLARCIAALRGAGSADEDVARLRDAVLAHAGGAELTDDLTIASCERRS